MELSTCARSSDGSVRCWGANGLGQLGVGDNADRTTPTVTGETAAGLGGGGLHPCVRTAGAIRCAGANAQGELGDGTTSDRAAFVSVVGFGEAIGSPVAGEGHTCSLTSGGRVACWGTNTAGELGDNTTTERSTPVYVTTS